MVAYTDAALTTFRLVAIGIQQQQHVVHAVVVGLISHFEAVLEQPLALVQRGLAVVAL